MPSGLYVHNILSWFKIVSVDPRQCLGKIRCLVGEFVRDCYNLTIRISKIQNFLDYVQNMNFEDFILEKNELILANVIDKICRFN